MATISLFTTPGPARIPMPGIMALTAIALLWSAGCAKISEPLPPKVLIPKPAVDLSARQSTDSIVLSVSMPDQNTDGSAVTTLRNVDLLRLTEGPSQSDDPLPEEQFLKRSARILSIPAPRFSEYLEEKTLILPDKLLVPEGSDFGSFAFRYAVLFVNNKNQAAGLSNQVVIKPVPMPLPPAELSAELTEDFIRLKWLPPSRNMDGSKPARIAGYNIYRSEEAGKFASTPVNPIPAQNPGYEDRSFQFDRTYYYAVSTVGSINNPYAESGLSNVISTVTRDIFPPLPPGNFTAVLDGESVVLFWTASPSGDLAGYRIQRIDEGSGARQPLMDELVTALSYRDSGADQKYRYSIVAVDTHGNESAPVTNKSEAQ